MLISDWSSDVCSSDLLEPDEAVVDRTATRFLDPGPEARAYWNESVVGLTQRIAAGEADKVVLARRVQAESEGSFELKDVLERLRDRKSVVSGKSVSVRDDLGGRRRLKKKKKTK